MKLQKGIAIILFSTAIIIAQPTSNAYPSPQGPGEGCCKMGMMPPVGGPGGIGHEMINPPPMMMNIVELQTLMDGININKTISAKIITIARGFLKAFDEKILKVQKEELAIKEELIKDKPDLNAIQSAIARKSSVFADIEFLQIKRDLEIKSLLSIEEYDRWKSAMMQKMQKMMPPGFNRGGARDQDKKGSAQN